MEPMKKKVMMSFFTYSSGKKPWIKRVRVEKIKFFAGKNIYPRFLHPGIDCATSRRVKMLP